VFLGGVITQWLSWPWIFWLYVPIALIALAAIPKLMPAGGAQRGKVDLTGVISVTAGLALAVFAIVRAPQEGWGSAQTIGGWPAPSCCLSPSWSSRAPARRRWCAWRSSAPLTSPEPTWRSCCSGPRGSRWWSPPE